MKKILKKIIVQLMVIATILGVVDRCFAADRSASVAASGTKPLVVGPILDDFRYAAPINVWNAPAGVFSRSTVIPTPANEKCAASYTNNPAITYGGTGNSLKLDYDVSRPFDPALPESATNYSTYAGYYSSMGGGSLTSPTAYTALSFYVKGAVGGEFFKIQLKNTSGDNIYFANESYPGANDATHYSRNTSSAYITDYLDSGVTTSWQKVTIPMHNFANLNGWSSMKEFVIVFENVQNTTNGTAKQGTIYIDNIAFETTPIIAVRIDHFGDKLGVSALNGNIGTAVSASASSDLNRYGFSNVTNEYSPYPYGFKLKYNVTPTGAWAATYLIFGGGNTNVSTPENPVASEHPERGGWIALPHNFGAYNYIYFGVRARSGTENPKEMKIELKDSAGTRAIRIIGITTGWQAYRISLNTDFPGLDKTAIKQLTFVFEGDRIGNAGGDRAGFVFIDSVQFEQ